MFGLFRRKPLLDAETRRWQLDVFEWLLRNTGGMAAFEGALLIEPTSRYFSPSVRDGHQCALELFESVKVHAGLAEWPCVLEIGEPDLPDHAGPGLMIVHEGHQPPAGTFEIEGDERVEGVIRYKPGLERDPVSFIATMAHELGHYLIATARTPPPGGWELEEPVTDIAAVFLGFGLFTVNSVFNFSQFQSFEEQGWRSRRLGYLTEDEALFALAIFVRLARTDTAVAIGHLKPTLRRRFERCLSDLDADSERLAAVSMVSD